ncbi:MULTISPECIES: hypothetical protein [unclassified Nocardioides]|uniref:hypothetical protein n=1 Tax=unclassified Nocardioides TaxID=2615069 RepID=UPI0000570662|nr:MULTISPECIES: hypothetical protein [unclassified Nocardioides]ABL82313.1 hypothetical protein Noca_2811 [Nocardioides sp. JS614]
MARSSRRILAAAVAALSLALSGVGAAGGPAPATAAPASATPGKAGAVTYTPNTVVVPAALVRDQLMRVSKDGATYTFKKRTQALRKLQKGSVMLLERVAVRNVLSVKIVRTRLVVKTTDASLTDFVADGTLAWDSALNWAKAFPVSGAGVPLRPGARAADGSFTLSGQIEGYGWSATFTPSKTAMAVKIAITREKPIELEVSITGSLTNLRTAGAIDIDKGKLGSAQWAANNVKGKFELGYTAKPISAFGLGQAGGIKVTLPVEVAVPFMVGAVPFYVGIKVAFFASAGFSGFDQELAGSYTLEYDGNSGFSLSNSGATTSQGVLEGLGKIILGAAEAVATGPISFVFGAQLPQLELGMGTKGLNIAGHVTLVGQTGIATYGAGCDTRKYQILSTAGATAEFFGLSAALGTVKLFDQSYYASYPPGCGVFPG